MGSLQTSYTKYISYFRSYSGTKPGGRGDTANLVPMLMQQENNAKIQNRKVKSAVHCDKYYPLLDTQKSAASHSYLTSSTYGTPIFM